MGAERVVCDSIRCSWVRRCWWRLGGEGRRLVGNGLVVPFQILQLSLAIGVLRRISECRAFLAGLIFKEALDLEFCVIHQAQSAATR